MHGNVLGKLRASDFDKDGVGMSTDQIFVYGTLRRGGVLSDRWPAAPLDVRPAWCRGKLYHGSEYPAMVDGDDRVGGELWRFGVSDLPDVLEMLDRVEVFNQPGEPDLYRRVRVEVWDEGGRSQGIAWVYRFAQNPIDVGFRPLAPPAADQVVVWTSEDQ